MVSKALQSVKIRFNSINVDGRVTSWSLGFQPKAPLPIVEVLEGSSKVTVSSSLNPPKACFLMISTLPGMVKCLI